MKKLLLFLVLITSLSLSYGQAYRGYQTDNFSGIHAGLSNPALLKNDKLDLEFNLISIDALLSNNSFEVDYENLDDYQFVNADGSTDMIVDLQILGPSILFQVGEKGMLGLSTRFRSMVNGADIDKDLADVLLNGLDDQTGDINLTEDGFGLVENSWAELGLSYAREIYQNKRTRLKGGLTLKYLYGANAIGLNTNNLSFDYTDNLLPTTSIVNLGGELRYTTNKDLLASDDILQDLQDGLGDGTGFGGDIGFTYELKNLKTTEDDYFVRIAASLLDVGKINYKVTEQVYTLDDAVDITEEDFDKLGDKQTFEEFITTNYGPGAIQSEEKNVSFNLPTQLQLGADIMLTRKIYLNATSNIAMTKPENKNETKALTHHTLTPRYESKLLGVWSPVGIDEFDNFTWGAGFRFGPLFVGSGSALSALLTETKIIDAYAGIKIPIASKGDKDSDQDGVPNKDDSCKRTPGVAENFGCPAREKEEGIVEELVVEETLVEEPIVEKTGVEEEIIEAVDTDLDGVIDTEDECPEVPGVIENKGCPAKPKVITDKDGDGIKDDVDQCPDVAGTIENKGCPVTLAELEVFRQDVREIYFDTGKSDVNLNSAARLKNAIQVMKKFPEKHWIIEGHSDSQGDEGFNQKLSEKRAEEVKVFFAQNGINPSQLKSYGYGESRPQTTNATEAGRAKNRRVEIRAANKDGKLVGLDLPKEDVLDEMSNLVKFVYFETGSDRIIENSKAQLELIAYYMNKYGGKYEIQGHTDSVGNEEFNMILSEKRAKSVVNFLTSMGVDPLNLKAAGYGELVPVADNATKDGQAENRRIEIKAVK